MDVFNSFGRKHTWSATWMFLTPPVESIPNQPCGICMCILFTYSICPYVQSPGFDPYCFKGTNRTKTNKSLGLLLLLSFCLKYILLFVIFSCISWSHSVAPSWPKAHHIPASAPQMHRSLSLQTCYHTWPHLLRVVNWELVTNFTRSLGTK